LKLEYDVLLSTSAFEFNLRRYNKDKQTALHWACVRGRGLHSSTFQLTLSRF
jgi:hypothetical protein